MSYDAEIQFSCYDNIFLILGALNGTSNMINEKLKKVLCGIVAERYQDKDSFEATMSFKTNTYEILGNKFEILCNESVWLTDNNISIKFNEHKDNVLTINDYNLDTAKVYEFYKIGSKVYLMLDTNYETINRISTIELHETDKDITFKINSVKGSNYNINSIDNFWISVLTGTIGKRANIYCIKSANNSLWIKRRYGETEIAMSYNYPTEKKYTLQFLNTPGKYSLYRFNNSSVASIVFEHPKYYIEKDVLISATTISEIGKSRTYTRVQKDTQVYYK